MMRARFWPLVAIVLGLAATAALWWLGRAEETTRVYAPSALPAAVGQFQSAVTLDDIRDVFGTPIQRDRIEAMDAVNERDLGAFVPTYTLFLVAAALMLGGLRSPLAWAAIVFALAGGAADAMETTKQLALTQDLVRQLDESGEVTSAAGLPIAPWYWAKYGSLALHTLACVLICWLSARKRWLLGAAGLAPIIGVLANATGQVQLPLTLVFGVFWMALVLVAAKEIIKPSPAPATGASA